MNLVNVPIAGKRLSKRLYQYRDKLAENVTHNIITGLFEGKSYAEIARRVNEETEASYKQALRIARTEAGRTQSTTTQKGYVEAKKKGIDIKKRWLATLDKKTRHDHRELDGQTVEVDEKFSIRGHTAEGPRLFGVASEDIGCRCTTIEVIDGIAPELRKDNETKAVIKYKNYNEWLANKENQAKDAIIGLKTPDGITIESLAAHLYERKDERSVDVKHIIRTVKHPIKIDSVKYDNQGRPSKKYIGDYATIAINPDDGRIITVYPTSRKRRKKIRSERNGTL
ncbi:NAD(+)-arginine ADP-ribosyltransferase EFV [Enterococcus sp. DIV1283b]